MRIGIVSAMDSEHRQLSARLAHAAEAGGGSFRYVEGTLGANEVVLTQCGIGKVNAAVGACELLRRYGPDCVLSTGVAGGIDACLRVGDVVASAWLTYHDVWCGEGNEWGQVQGFPARFSSDSALVEKALRVESDSRIYKGLICSGDRFISAPEELAEIKHAFPEGMAVDMESGSIAQVCYLRGVPFLSFRIISDTPGVEGHMAQYKHFWDDAPRHSFEVLSRLIANL